MTGAIRLAAEVSENPTPEEIDHAAYAVHYWSGDYRNHKYSRMLFRDPNNGVFAPHCISLYPVASRWAFLSELSEELGDDRDKSRDCFVCFRRTSCR